MGKERTSVERPTGISLIVEITALVAEAYAKELDREIMADLKKRGGEDDDQQREDV